MYKRRTSAKPCGPSSRRPRVGCSRRSPSSSRCRYWMIPSSRAAERSFDLSTSRLQGPSSRPCRRISRRRSSASLAHQYGNGCWRYCPSRRRQLCPCFYDFPAHTAGGLMTTEYIRVPPAFTVEETLRLIQRAGRESETVYVVYVVDPDDGRLSHVVSLRELVLSDRGRRVTEIGSGRDLRSIPIETARTWPGSSRSTDLGALPVVDDAGRIPRDRDGG